MVSIREQIEKIIEKETTIKEDRGVSVFEMLTPAFAGGVLISIFLGVPGLNLLVFLIPLGGYYAVKLVNQYYEKTITESDAAKVGAFAGIIGAFLGILITFTLATFYADPVLAILDNFLDPHAAELVLLLSGLDPYLSVNTFGLRLIANLVLGVALGIFGGVLYVKRTPEAGYSSMLSSGQ